MALGQVDLIPRQVNFAQPLAQGQVLEKIICQPLNSDISKALRGKRQ
jgi:hypothetical protein